MIVNEGSCLKEKDTILFRTTRGGSPPLSSMRCDICREKFDVLTPINFSKMIWICGDSFEAIHKNPYLKKFNLNLCYECKKKIFVGSVVTIKYDVSLFEALKSRGRENE